MTPELISCPQCGKSIDPNASLCEYCGVNLALAALLAERDIQPDHQELQDFPISPEILVPRLGDYLIEKGVLQPEELQKALDYQKNHDAVGQTKLIGQALLDLGYVVRETLDQVVTEQILELQSALHQANVELEKRVFERTSELKNALRRLAELNQLKSNFIANISHELRTPLTHLRGYIELLTDEGLGPINEDQKGALQVMKKSEGRLEKLIEDLIQFSLVARGDLDLKITKFSLTEVFNEIWDVFVQKSKMANISLSINLPKNVPAVQGDQEKITWVLSQLVDNAIKFTPGDGSVQLGARAEAQVVTLSVFDTGIGIPDDQLDEIFESFHQLDGSATRRYGGTGMGLSMARQIIEAHGSKFIVRSHLGEGSIFEFSLSV
jgi:signal transduction histidine kinase